MTDVIDHAAQTNSVQPGVSDARIKELVEQARAEGLPLTGDGGLPAKLTRLVVECALEGEMDEHLGYRKSDPAGEAAATPATQVSRSGAFCISRARPR
ncbi:hypothetical protein [Rhodococcus sp. IEGM 1318]|uniref:hypothetical protein n=1 Tax=Rhodococcus sp. IEGM 1318 TaxID=3082226 RepID=UPI0029556114|nr:hypothetical protein [Rhodococcus sp. IEGM 1318]MDV8009013.1 hypothetical protein [Rhodococcus sp. IEGM 1318]